MTPINFIKIFKLLNYQNMGYGIPILEYGMDFFSGYKYFCIFFFSFPKNVAVSINMKGSQLYDALHYYLDNTFDKNEF